MGWSWMAWVGCWRRVGCVVTPAETSVGFCTPGGFMLGRTISEISGRKLVSHCAPKAAASTPLSHRTGRGAARCCVPPPTTTVPPQYIAHTPVYALATPQPRLLCSHGTRAVWCLWAGQWCPSPHKTHTPHSHQPSLLETLIARGSTYVSTAHAAGVAAPHHLACAAHRVRAVLVDHVLGQ